MSMRNPYPKRIGPSAMPTGAAASVFTAEQRLAVRQWIFTNTTGGDLAVSVYIVSSGGSATTANRIVSVLTVPLNDLVVVNAPIILEAGDKVYGLATGAVNLTFVVNDRETEVL